MKAAEHLYAIIDGKPKDFLGTTYAHIKEIISAVYECGYFDKSEEIIVVPEPVECQVMPEQEEPEPVLELEEVENVQPIYAPPTQLPAPPAPPAPTAVPTPAYTLRALPPITLQEVEHAYFAQQYPQQRPISEVIGSQNFFFLQESEIDSPVGTPQPPPILNQQPSPGPIPTQTFTNQHYVIPGSRVPEPGTIPMPPQPHFPPHPDQVAYQGVPIPAPMAAHPVVHGPPQPGPPMQQVPQPIPHQIHFEQQIQIQPEERNLSTPIEDKIEEDSKESRSPERDDGDRKTQGQGDGQNRFRRYRGSGRGSSNGFRGRGSFQNRQNNDNYHGRHGDYQSRPNKEGYRQYS
ncbi:jg21709, partial [Pararge aegeria aegeria]